MTSNMVKTIILIGGPGKGTRFRPLSMDVPKPLFPVAGFPVIYHHIEAATQVEGMKEIFIIGSYQPSDAITRFINNAQQEFNVKIRYLQEYEALGTAGAIYHFRDPILAGSPEQLLVMNGDVCGDFPLKEMFAFHRQRNGGGASFTILGTEATRQQSLNYGCIVEFPETHEVRHYVEKPETFVSSIINCGIYLFSPEIFDHIKEALRKIEYDVDYTPGRSSMEQDIFSTLAGSGLLFVYHTDRFWSQVKFSGAAIYANRHYLNIYHRTHPERLAKDGEGQPKIIGDVFIHSSATVHPSAMLGPNVTIGANVTVGAGVRIRESILLEGAVIKDHSCILYSIIGWNSTIGEWSRVEGTPNDPNPNKPFAKLDVVELFTSDGKLAPSITVTGSNVTIPSEEIILNSIVMPHKELNRSYKNQIIL